MQKLVLRLLLLSTFAFAPAVAAESGPESGGCAANPDAIGLSRIMQIDTTGGPRYGTYQYPVTLALGPKEVVLTFDDGPNPKNTPKILDALDAHCVKATFFAVGQWAEFVPELTREIVRRGHTLGTHSWSHPFNLKRLASSKAELEIEKGFSAVETASGGAVAPFFRYPGLNDSAALNGYLAKRDTAVLSCDIAGDDWLNIGAAAIVSRVLARLEHKDRGILLFHDTKASTAKALPLLLSELKARGFQVVHIVPKQKTIEPRPTEPQGTDAAEEVALSKDARPAPLP